MYHLTSAGTTYANKLYDAGKDPANNVIVYISDAREPVTPEELCDYFRSSSETMDKILHMLTNKGLIELVGQSRS